MTIVLVLSLFVGFLTGQSSAKKEIIKNDAYFCYVEGGIKRCYEVKEDPYAKQDFNSNRSR